MALSAEVGSLQMRWERAGVIHWRDEHPMIAGVWNLLFGLVAVAAGASGRFELLFVGGSTALEVAGSLVTLLGVTQVVRAYRRQRMR